jgi:DNA-binding IclR family transcriptional regulator
MGFTMATEFKRVPAIDRCFAILQLVADSKRSLGISEIARNLGLYKGTVFNLVHTLASLEVLEHGVDGKFRLGTGLYALGNAAGGRSELIQTVRPFLEKINQDTQLSAFLGIRSGLKAVVIDKADLANDLKISSEIGMQMPLLGGAHGKAILSQLPDGHIDRILASHKLRRFTPNSIVGKTAYKKEIQTVRKQGVAYDREEYMEGVVALSVPVETHRQDLQTAIWVVGLKRQAPEERLPDLAVLLKGMAVEINNRFCMPAQSLG